MLWKVKMQSFNSFKYFFAYCESQQANPEKWYSVCTNAHAVQVQYKRGMVLLWRQIEVQGTICQSQQLALSLILTSVCSLKSIEFAPTWLFREIYSVSRAPCDTNKSAYTIGITVRLVVWSFCRDLQKQPLWNEGECYWSVIADQGIYSTPKLVSLVHTMKHCVVWW